MDSTKEIKEWYQGMDDSSLVKEYLFGVNNYKEILILVDVLQKRHLFDYAEQKLKDLEEEIDMDLQNHELEKQNYQEWKTAVRFEETNTLVWWRLF